MVRPLLTYNYSDMPYEVRNKSGETRIRYRVKQTTSLHDLCVLYYYVP